MLASKKHLFFDLDRTLWDFETNSVDTFKDIFQLFNLQQLGVQDFEQALETYRSINDHLWDEYREGIISKDFLNVERFHQTLLSFKINNRQLAYDIAQRYIRISPTKTALFEGTHEILSYLKKGNYNLHIITNGFPEVQHVKLQYSDLRKYFTALIISEEVGWKKPSPEIFRKALEMAEATVDESVMIGDDPIVDIQGATDIGMEAIFVNHHQEPFCDFCKYQVNHLLHLKDLF
ncbi:MAG: YjjG family noncanonical pyrimidine nucleotidase [Bacteroidales bacterium]|nr:YjjG family noncanonical pyrimidine nucleotidase [Bacteroidales bacterium]